MTEAKRFRWFAEPFGLMVRGSVFGRFELENRTVEPSKTLLRHGSPKEGSHKRTSVIDLFRIRAISVVLLYRSTPDVFILSSATAVRLGLVRGDREWPKDTL